jgi:hypothetical protein
MVVGDEGGEMLRDRRALHHRRFAGERMRSTSASAFLAGR